MLKITIEVLPGGRDLGRPALAEAYIKRVTRGPNADYEVQILEGKLGEVGIGAVRAYPRYAASVWDLVVRGVADALAGKQQLPRPPVPLQVPIRTGPHGTQYVRLSDIPQPARSYFETAIFCSACPVIEHELDPRGCAYATDWLAFLSGGQW